MAYMTDPYQQQALQQALAQAEYQRKQEERLKAEEEERKRQEDKQREMMRQLEQQRLMQTQQQAQQSSGGMPMGGGAGMMQMFGGGGGAAGGAAGAEAAGGAAGAEGAGMGAMGWAALLAAVIAANEKGAKDSDIPGIRSESDSQYAGDLITGRVSEQDFSKRWLPKMFGEKDPETGRYKNDDYGFAADTAAVFDIGTGDWSNAWDTLRKNSTLATALKKIF